MKYRPMNAARWRAWLWPALLWAAAAWLLGLPLVRPHGPFLWGHYRFLDLYLGLPVALAAVLVTLVRLRPPESRRPLALRLAALWLSVVVFAVLFDAAYAIFVVGAWRADYWLDQAHIPRLFSAPDAELGFVRKPGVVWRGRLAEDERSVEYRTDENGFRNPPGRKNADVVFIGDSFTEAAQVAAADTFVERTEKETGLTVANLGRGAYGPQQELTVLKRYGLAYQPRAVVWQIFEGNDLSDADNFARWKRQPEPPLSLARRYSENSLLQVLLAGTRAVEPRATPVTMRFGGGEERKIALRYRYEPGQAEAYPLGFAEMTQAIAEGHRLCQARGIKMVVLFVPIMARVMEPWLKFESREAHERWLAGGRTAQTSDAAHRLAAFCAENAVPFLDTFPALRRRAEADNRDVYIPADEHLDRAGHEAVAQAVAAWLDEKLRDAPHAQPAVQAAAIESPTKP
jgi:lysophospholipase L1-like esterase